MPPYTHRRTASWPMQPTPTPKPLLQLTPVVRACRVKRLQSLSFRKRINLPFRIQWLFTRIIPFLKFLQRHPFMVISFFVIQFLGHAAHKLHTTQPRFFPSSNLLSGRVSRRYPHIFTKEQCPETYVAFPDAELMLNLRPNLGTPYPKLNWAMGMPYWEAVELSIHRARQCWDPHWSLKRGYDNETADAIWNRMLWAIDEARLKYASPNPDENVYIRKWSHYEEWFHTNDTRFEWWREYYQERSAHIGFVVEIMGEPGYGERGSPVMDLHTRRLGTDGLEMCNYNTILNRYTTGFETAQRTYAQIYRWLLRKSPLFRRIAIWAELNVEMREPGGHFGVNTATGDAKFYTWLMQPRKWYQVYCSIVDIDSHSQASVLVKWNYDWGVGEMVRAVSERWCNQALGYARRRVPKFEYLEGQFVQWAGVVGEFSDGIRAKGCSNLCK